MRNTSKGQLELKSSTLKGEGLGESCLSSLLGICQVHECRIPVDPSNPLMLSLTGKSCSPSLQIRQGGP